MTEADKLVVIAFQQGDLKVFETVFKENYPSLCRTARRYLIDKSAAESSDAVNLVVTGTILFI